VEQSIGQLAIAWSLRRWRGLLYRARDVFRAAAALISLAAGSTGYPPEQASRTPSMGPTMVSSDHGAARGGSNLFER
jgi:hypothetical protein